MEPRLKMAFLHF